MDLAQITNQLQVLWQRVPQKALSHALIATLFIYLAYWAASMTWLLTPNAPVQSPQIKSTVNKSTTSSNQDVDVLAITKLNLFGDYKKQAAKPKPVQNVESAPQTTLRLTLTGVVASDDARIASAIIESRGTQETYGIDDKITGTRAILKQVYADRVIIESSGRMETLMLDGFEYSKQVDSTITKPKAKSSGRSLRNAKAKPVEQNNRRQAQARIKQHVEQLRTEIANDPSKITDYLRISPYRREGEVVGYRLMPSKNPEFFKDVGLIAGDIAVQINGHDLTDMAQAQQALMELRSAEHVDLLVERDGVLHDISLGL